LRMRAEGGCLHPSFQILDTPGAIWEFARRSPLFL
jgi:hypothetical protein